MGRTLRTIYDYFSDYSEEEINNMLYLGLTIKEKLLINDRYGYDLHHPKTSESWNEEKKDRFYGSLVPKMCRLLASGIYAYEVNSEEESEIVSVDYTTPLLQLLKEGKTNKEICENLNINSDELSNELLKLKNMEVNYQRKYYSDGSIKYETKQVNNRKIYTPFKKIITDINENNIKVLVISDLHIGNELERIDLLDCAFNYCVKNGIHIILCGGDFIDGAFTRGTQRITDMYKQIDYFLKNYPRDESILTFGVAGDHDFSAYEKSSLDIIEMCNNYRHDIIIGGYANALFYIKNDKIQLYHRTKTGTIEKTGAPIILHAHCHRFHLEERNNVLNIAVPTLSSVNQPMPTALELNMSFNKGIIADTLIKHIYFGEQDITLGEFRYNLAKKRMLNCEPVIKNVEFFRQDLVRDEYEEDTTLRRII